MAGGGRDQTGRLRVGSTESCHSFCGPSGGNFRRKRSSCPRRLRLSLWQLNAAKLNPALSEIPLYRVDRAGGISERDIGVRSQQIERSLLQAGRSALGAPVEHMATADHVLGTKLAIQNWQRHRHAPATSSRAAGRGYRSCVVVSRERVISYSYGR